MKSKLAILLLGVSTLGANAADTFDINVTGVIKPPACVGGLNGGDTIDYGNIFVSKLNPAVNTGLGEKTADFTINCRVPTRMGFVVHDNQAGTVLGSGVSRMGFGLDKSGNKIGLYMINMNEADMTIDTAPTVSTLSSTDNGTTWSKAGIMYINPESTLYSFANGGEKTPVAFSQLTGKLTIIPFIAPTTTLDLSEPIHFEGLTTFELVYL